MRFGVCGRNLSYDHPQKEPETRYRVSFGKIRSSTLKMNEKGIP